VSAPTAPWDLVRATAGHLYVEYAAILVTGSPGSLCELSAWSLYDRRGPQGARSLGEVTQNRANITFKTRFDAPTRIVVTWTAVRALLEERVGADDRARVARAYEVRRGLLREYCTTNDVHQALWLGYGGREPIPDGMTADRARDLANAAHHALYVHDQDVLRVAVVDALNTQVDLLDLLALIDA
jgi:hypothetical protein